MAHLLCMEVAGADWLKQPNTTGGLSFAWSQLSLTETTVQCFHFVWRGGNTRGPLGLLTGLGPGGNAGGKALGCREPSHNIPQTWLCCTWMLPPPTAGSSLVPHGPAVALGAAQHPAAPAGGCGLGRGQGMHGGHGRRMEPAPSRGPEQKDERQQNIPPEHEENTVQVAGAWDRLPGEVMQSPSLETIRIHVDTILNVLEGTCWSRGAGPADVQWSLPILTPLWVCLFLPSASKTGSSSVPAPGISSLGRAFQGWGPSARPAGGTGVLTPGWARWGLVLTLPR